MLSELRREKTGLRDFRPGLTQTGVNNPRRMLDTWYLGYE